LARARVSLKLIEFGANLLAIDPTGATALHHIAGQYLQIFQLSAKRYITEYDETRHENCLKLWKSFLDLGGSINAGDNTGSSRSSSTSPARFLRIMKRVFAIMLSRSESFSISKT
jgi:hypothetical protein